MVIKRQFGSAMKEIELTEAELRRAFYEQQQIFDKTDMEYHIIGVEDWLLDKGLSQKDIEKLSDHAEELGEEMRRNINKYDMDWDSAKDKALEWGIKFFVQNKGEFREFS